MPNRRPRAAQEYRPQRSETLHGMRANGELQLTVSRKDQSRTLTTNDWWHAYDWLGQDEPAWRLLCLLGCPTCAPPKGSMRV